MWKNSAKNQSHLLYAVYFGLEHDVNNYDGSMFSFLPCTASSGNG